MYPSLSNGDCVIMHKIMYELLINKIAFKDIYPGSYIVRSPKISEAENSFLLKIYIKYFSASKYEIQIWNDAPQVSRYKLV